MPSSTSGDALPAKLTNELSELFQQLCIPQLRRKALDEFLTDGEVRLIAQGKGPNRPGVEHVISGKRIVEVLATSRRWSQERALIELAFGLDILAPSRFQRLRGAIGEQVAPSDLTNFKLKPHWDRDRGKLFFRDKAIKKVRICSSATCIERILEAFEKKGWNSTILQPFGGDISHGELHRAVHRLNADLKAIRFGVRAGAKELYWELKRKRTVRVPK